MAPEMMEANVLPRKGKQRPRKRQELPKVIRQEWEATL